jgi:hypothetical protein
MSELIFHAIKTFVSDLADVFSTENHPLALYDRLISKTSIAHKDAVEKHIAAFRKFYTENKEKILNNELSGFTCNIEYSQKVFIDLNELLAKNSDSRDCVRMHLLTIGAFIDPNGPAKDVLRQIGTATDGSNGGDDVPKTVRFDGDSSEEQMLNDIMKKVESAIDPSDISSPNDAMAKIMGSGMINDLVGSIGSKMASGNLDISKMFGAVQNMMGTISKDVPADDPQMRQLMGMMNMVGSTLSARK